jgi:trans-2,3-dihydro-3-hydroxyanthranilate isomerase
MRYKFYTADVFTDRVFGGNPLAVFTDGRGLDGATMQRVARELNLSETVFVLPPDDPAHTRRLRIFTPGGELPFAGHPTVGTAFVLAQIGEVALAGERTGIVFEEGVGPVPVTIFAGGGRPTGAQLTAARLPAAGAPPPPAAELAAMLGLEPGDVRQDQYGPEAIASGGPAFTIVPLRDRAALGRAKLRLEHWERLLAGTWAQEVYPICLDPELPGSHVRVRMFAPSIGIAEVEADMAGGELRAVRVGGAAVMVSEGQFDVPDGVV